MTDAQTRIGQEKRLLADTIQNENAVMGQRWIGTLTPLTPHLSPPILLIIVWRFVFAANHLGVTLPLASG